MNDKEQNESIETSAVVSTTALEAITRGEVDSLMIYASNHPRTMKGFISRAIEMATIDEETAESCIYNRPVGDGKYADGLSIRMAEIVGSSYRNLRCGARIVEMTDRYVKAQGFAIDLETNWSSYTEVIESTVKKNSQPMSERMRIVISKAALAKARRDAIFQVIPRALCKPIEREARKIIVGDGTSATISTRRARAMTWVKKLGIDTARVFAAIGVQGEEDMGIDSLLLLNGLKTSINDGEITVDEAFPGPELKAGAIPITGGAKMSASTKPKTETKQPPATPPEPEVDQKTGEVKSEVEVNETQTPIPDDNTTTDDYLMSELSDTARADLMLIVGYKTNTKLKEGRARIASNQNFTDREKEIMLYHIDARIKNER